MAVGQKEDRWNRMVDGELKNVIEGGGRMERRNGGERKVVDGDVEEKIGG